MTKAEAIATAGWRNAHPETPGKVWVAVYLHQPSLEGLRCERNSTGYDVQARVQGPDGLTVTRMEG